MRLSCTYLVIFLSLLQLHNNDAQSDGYYDLEVPAGVHSMCWDANSNLWAGGIFNIAGTEQALNLARYNPSTGVWDRPLSVGVNTTFELMTNNSEMDEEELMGVVKVLKCPTTGNYIYVGGFFSYAYTYSDSAVTPSDGSADMTLDQHTRVNNYFRYDTVNDVIEPLYPSSTNTTDDYNGFRNTGSDAGYVGAVECANTECTKAYVGGLFDAAVGVFSLNNVVYLDGSDWTAPTITEIGLNSANFDSTECSSPVYGADGHVLSIEVVDTDLVLIGGAFLKAGCSPSSALVRYIPSTDKIECVQRGTAAVCGQSASSMALCCYSIIGPIQVIERVSTTSAVVGGYFNSYDSQGSEIEGDRKSVV